MSNQRFQLCLQWSRDSIKKKVKYLGLNIDNFLSGEHVASRKPAYIILTP